MEDSSKSLEFPLNFSKCPACGCEETVARRVTEDDAAARGLLEKSDTHPMISQSVTPIVDLRALSVRLTVDILVAYYDVCLDCGCYYCVHVEKQKGLVGPPPGGFPLPGQGKPS